MKKVTVDQKAILKMISNDQILSTTIIYNTDQSTVASGDNSSNVNYSNGAMSGDLVKFSLDSKEGGKNGFHVQAVINFGDTPVEVSTKAIQYDKTETTYVLEDNFRTILQKVTALAPG